MFRWGGLPWIGAGIAALLAAPAAWAGTASDALIKAHAFDAVPDMTVVSG